jgi:hypothetical protein
VFLKKLDLGKNKLGKIESLDTLLHLTQLSLEDNEVCLYVFITFYTAAVLR